MSIPGNKNTFVEIIRKALVAGGIHQNVYLLVGPDMPIILHNRQEAIVLRQERPGTRAYCLDAVTWAITPL